MDCIELSDNTSRQVIDSTTVFHEFVRVKAHTGTSGQTAIVQN